MKRKRFVKLLMANGYSRNAANAIADTVPALGLSYKIKYASMLKPLNYLLSLIGGEQMCKRLSEAITYMANCITEAATKIISALADIFGMASSVIEQIKAISDGSKPDE